MVPRCSCLARRYPRGRVSPPQVANYQTLGQPCPRSAFDNVEGQSLGQYCDRNGLGRHVGCCRDPCHLLDQFNSANNELNFVQLLSARMHRALPLWSPRFLIDTGRNGVDGVLRQSCSNWCNVRGAGLGRRPTAATDLPEVDAYFWVCFRGARAPASRARRASERSAFDSLVRTAQDAGGVRRVHRAAARRLLLPAIRPRVRVGRLNRLAAGRAARA